MGLPPRTASDAPSDLPGQAAFGEQAKRRDDLVVWGTVSAALALLAPLLGVLAIILGEVARRQGDRRGGWVSVAGGAGLVVGAFLAIVLVRILLPDLWTQIGAGP